MIERTHPKLSVGAQCQLLSISRSSFCYTPQGETAMTHAYNTERPHPALGYQAPAVFAAQLNAMGDQLRATEPLRRSPIAPSAQPRQIQQGTLVSVG